MCEYQIYVFRILYSLPKLRAFKVCRITDISDIYVYMSELCRTWWNIQRKEVSPNMMALSCHVLSYMVKLVYALNVRIVLQVVETSVCLVDLRYFFFFLYSLFVENLCLSPKMRGLWGAFYRTFYCTARSIDRSVSSWVKQSPAFTWLGRTQSSFYVCLCMPQLFLVFLKISKWLISWK